VDQEPEKKEDTFSPPKGFRGLFLNYIRFKGIKASNSKYEFSK